IAHKSAGVYLFHHALLQFCPGSKPGHFFGVANCCYRASRSCSRCCVALGKNTLEALTRNPPRGGRAKPIAPAARAAPQHHHLARDAEHLGHLPDSEVVELMWFHSARSTLWKTRARIRLPAFAENDGIGRLREDANSLKLKRGCLVQTGGLSLFHRVILA